MKKHFQKLAPLFRRPQFLSPLYLLHWALLISVVYALMHLAGLREFTSILNGTIGSVALGWKYSIILAVIYVAVYLAFVVLVPIFILAAIMLALWQRAPKPDGKS